MNKNLKLCPAMVWCGESPRTLLSALEHLRRGFLLLLNGSFMYNSVNLSPVEELLTDVMSPGKAAKLMDDVYYEYVHALIYLALRPDLKYVLSDESLEHIWCLRTLRDVFQNCAG